MKVARQNLTIAGISLDCPDHRGLADFYVRLLNGSVSLRTDTATGVRAGSLHLIAQQVDDYQPPQWPGASIVHLDLSSPDFDLMQQKDFALSCGAVLASVQPDSRWAVLLDPAGHPFCLTPFTLPE
jgi:hypothetical protein